MEEEIVEPSIQTSEQKRAELIKSGDSHQYAAVPHKSDPDNGVLPEVKLVWMTPDPLGAMAFFQGVYSGRFYDSLEEVTDEDRYQALADVQKTHLQAPLEVIKVHLRFDGVDRAFTHQLVRQRTACLSGDTQVYTIRKERRYTLSELYEKLQAGGHSRKGVKCMRIRTTDNSGLIVYRRIAGVTQSGIRPVFELKTHDGRRIKATADHRFLVPGGDYVQLENLSVGDKVVSNGKKWSPEARETFSQWCKDNRTKNPDAYTGVDPGHRVAQALYKDRLLEGCWWCGETALELAHLDGNPDNNEFSNIEPMCKSCHRAMDRGVYPEKSYAAIITSIEPAGEEMTFDLGMEGEFKRFVANGLVVHNCYAQESMRFSVLGKLQDAVSHPPSLAGTKRPFAFNYEGEALQDIKDSRDYMMADDAQRKRMLHDYCINIIDLVYHELVEGGMPAEEARGLLPTEVATRINYVSDLRNMKDHAGNRLCTQAQFHWRLVWNGIIQQMQKYSDGTPSNDWQYKAIAASSLWRPVCYQVGHCPFTASFDRACTIRDRVDAFAAKGIPSSDWSLIQPPEGINPAEWMMDPSAARL